VMIELDVMGSVSVAFDVVGMSGKRLLRKVSMGSRMPPLEVVGVTVAEVSVTGVETSEATELVSETETEDDSEGVADGVAGAEAEADWEAEVSGSDTEAEAEADAEGDAEAEEDSDSDAEADAEADAEVEAEGVETISDDSAELGSEVLDSRVVELSSLVLVEVVVVAGIGRSVERKVSMGSKMPGRVEDWVVAAEEAEEAAADDDSVDTMSVGPTRIGPSEVDSSTGSSLAGSEVVVPSGSSDEAEEVGSTLGTGALPVPLGPVMGAVGIGRTTVVVSSSSSTS
jgi:hypothetical protein